jgi:hypothetical protein
LSTDTHDLIERLSADVKPVKRLPRPWLRAVLLTLASLVLALGVLRLVHEPRTDLMQALQDKGYELDGIMIFAAGACAAYAAFVLSVPDTRVRTPVLATLGMSTAIWLEIILRELLSTKAMPDPAPPCLIGLTIGMSAPLALGVVMMLRSAAVWRGLAGYAMVLAVGSFAALGMRFICPNDTPGHLLVWHFLPVIIFAIVGMPLFSILLKLTIAKK